MGIICQSHIPARDRRAILYADVRSPARMSPRRIETVEEGQAPAHVDAMIDGVHERHGEYDFRI